MNDTKSAPLIPPRMGTPMDPAHEADLHRSYLTDKTIQEAQIKSARREDIPMILGFDPPGIQSLCLFPYLGTPGNFFRAKVYPPPVDGAKYYQRQGTRSHLYIPPSVRKLLSNPAEPLTIVEGEKKTLRAIQEGLPAVGIGGLWSFQKDKKLIPEFESIAYVRREVVFYPDSDVWSRPDLLRPVYALAWELENRGAVIHVGILTPGPNGEKRGLDDYPNLEIDLAHNIIKGLKYVGLKDKTFAIPREWHATWKKDDNQDSTLQGQPLFQREVNPWRTPVNGQKLLEDLTAKIRQYVVLSDEAAVAAALWIIQTYCPDLMTCLAILAVTSTTKREGKTTLLEITTATCAKPVPTTNISSAALFRSIEGWGPTLICDEMDKQFKENDDLRTLFNAGHTRTTAFVIRVVGDATLD